MVAKHITPANGLLAASTQSTAAGLVMLFFPQQFSDMVTAVSVNLDARATLWVQLAGYDPSPFRTSSSRPTHLRWF